MYVQELVLPCPAYTLPSKSCGPLVWQRQGSSLMAQWRMICTSLVLKLQAGVLSSHEMLAFTVLNITEACQEDN